MAPVPDLDARLRARWQKHGGGPTLEARLKAAEAELSRRANVTVAERRGVRVPDASRVPVADPTPFGKENDHTKRTGDGKPPNYPSSIDPAAALSAAMKTTRAQTARSAAASNVDPHSIGMRGQKPGGGGGDDSSDDEEVLALEAGCVVVGESAADCQKKTNTNPSLGLNPNDPLVKLKNEANQSLLRGDFAIAGALYDEAVAAAVARLKQESDAPNASELSQTTHTSILLAVLYSNRAHVKMLSDPVDALGASADASCAIKQQNSNSKWHKPYLRKAAAEAYLGNWRLAMRCAREAESIASCQKSQKALREAVAILDTVAMNAAKEGSMAGFDGRTICTYWAFHQIKRLTFYLQRACDCCPYIATYSSCEGTVITSADWGGRNYVTHVARKTDAFFSQSQTSGPAARTLGCAGKPPPIPRSMTTTTTRSWTSTAFTATRTPPVIHCAQALSVKKSQSTRVP